MGVAAFRVAAVRVALCHAVLPALLAGCAATPPGAPASSAGSAAPSQAGTLVALRPVQAGDSRRSVLSALGAQGETPGGAAGAITEFIVTQDDGRTISVVQPDPGGLRAGLRVAVLPGGPRLLGTRITAVAQ